MMRMVELVTVLLWNLIHCRSVEIEKSVFLILQEKNLCRMTGFVRLNFCRYQMMRKASLGTELL